MKYLVVALPALLALVTSKTLTKYDTGVEIFSAYGYLTKVGIPLANEIRKAEDQSNTNKKKSQGTLDEPGYKIVDGYVANPGNIPYQAGLIADIGYGRHSACGGSLINAKRVVTAAHCWYDGEQQASRVTVVLGSLKLYSGGTRLQTSHVMMHSRWNPRYLENDIAMIYLPIAVQFSDTVSPIALPSGSDLQESFVGQTALASGFGHTRDYDHITYNSFLSYVELQVITNSECNSVYGIVTPSQICTKGAYVKNVCRGDSGGPLTIKKNNKRILIGITSFKAEKYCEDGLPAAFTRVTAFIEWINSHL